MKLLIPKLQQMGPLKFGKRWVISSSTLLGLWLLIHVGIKVNPCQQKGPPVWFTCSPLSELSHHLTCKCYGESMTNTESGILMTSQYGHWTSTSLVCSLQSNPWMAKFLKMILGPEYILTKENIFLITLVLYFNWRNWLIPQEQPQGWF